MEFFTSPPAIIIYIIAVALVTVFLKPQQKEKESPRASYKYERRDGIMTQAEVAFYKRLQTIVQDRYAVFPQIHLSSLATNKTTGRYYKAGFQRINRRSVDYVLADPQTLQAVYAIELDDRTHDSQKGQRADAIKAEILNQVSIPLVRFRNVSSMSDDDIVSAFEASHQQHTAQ